MALTSQPVLTVDIVNFSTRTVREQTELIQVFIKMLNGAIPKEYNNLSSRLWSPAGDGGALTFWGSVTAPMDTAIALAKSVNDYNTSRHLEVNSSKSSRASSQLQIRIGIHQGTVSKEIDFDNRENVWGDGMNTSARVVGLAQPGQILVSEDYYKAAELHDYPGIYISRLGKGWAKHNKSIELYNIWTDEVGLQSSETDEWFGPLHYPLQQAIVTYKGMLSDEYSRGKAFRVCVIAKRILDLDPRNPSHVDIASRRHTIEEVISHISEHGTRARVGQTPLTDPFFSKLTPSALLYFFRNARFDVFERGDFIVKENDPANTMMIIVSGEVGIYMGGSQLKVVDAETKSALNVVFQEGDIVGEMGLFNAAERRSATMKAEKNVMVLTIRYDFLRDMPGSFSSEDDTKREEIKREVWKYYYNRTIDNQLNYHQLLRGLPEVTKLMLRSKARFLPETYQDIFHISVEELWDSWTIVVSGGIKVITRFNDSVIEYKRGSCIGPVRFSLESCPYKEVSILPNTQLIIIPLHLIRDLFRDPTYGEFRALCADEGLRARLQMEANETTG